MPCDHNLNEFMTSIEDLAYRLVNPADSVDYDRRKERVKNALKEAYLAGYVQCEEDTKTRRKQACRKRLDKKSGNVPCISRYLRYNMSGESGQLLIACS